MSAHDEYIADLLRQCREHVPAELARAVDDGIASLSNARGSRLRPDWTPSSLTWRWAMDERPDLVIQQQLDAFRDYWCAKPGKDGRKLDWNATFKNWIRNARSMNGRMPPASRTEAAIGALERMKEGGSL